MVRGWTELEDRGVDGRTIKMDLQGTGSGSVDWVDVWDRNRWRAVVITVMNLRVP